MKKLKSYFAIFLAIVTMLSQCSLDVLAAEENTVRDAITVTSGVVSGSEKNEGQSDEASVTTTMTTESPTVTTTEDAAENKETDRLTRAADETAALTTSEDGTAESSTEDTTETTECTTEETTADETAETETETTTASVESTTEGTTAEGTTAGEETAFTGTKTTNLNDAGFYTEVSLPDSSQYTKDPDGKIVLYVGSIYSFSIKVKETDTTQFDPDSHSFTFTLPDSLDPIEASGNFSETVTASDGTPYTLNASYVISGQTVTITLEDDEAYDAFDAFMESAVAYLEVELQAALISEDVLKETIWTMLVDKQVTIMTDAALSVEKTGAYKIEDGEIAYTVKVTASGEAKNVVVTDAISGTAVTYKSGSLSVSSSKSGTVASETVGENTSETDDGKGFAYTIGDMTNGEVVTLTYRGTVDYTDLTPNSKFSAETTKNTVTANGSNTEPAEASNTLNGTKVYSDYSGTELKKSSGETTSADGNTETKTFVIYVNKYGHFNVSGTTVEDTLNYKKTTYTDKTATTTAVPLKYSGTGITIEKKTDSGTYTGYKTLTWEELDVTAKSDSWSYTFGDDAGYAEYKITYTVDADITNSLSSDTVYNTAEWYGAADWESWGVGPGPGGNEYGITKSHTNVEKQTDGTCLINYTITVSIPKAGLGGLGSLVIEDVLPSVKSDGISYQDTCVLNSLKVEVQTGENTPEELSASDGCTLDANETGKVTITLDPTADGQVKTLLGSSSKDSRTVIITLQIKTAADWPAGEAHTNTANVTLKGVKKSASDVLVFGQTIKKEFRSSGTGSVTSDGSFGYALYLTGVDSPTVEIEEYFDTTLFELTDIKVGMSDESAAKALENSQSSNGGSGSVSDLSADDKAGKKLTIDINQNDGTYANYYCITYTLRAKDSAALQEAAAKEDNGTLAVTNEAKWGELSSTDSSAAYVITPLSKSEIIKPGSANDYVAEFQIVINESKITLNDGNDMVLIDTLSGELRLVDGSLKVSYDGEEQSAPAYSYDEGDSGAHVLTMSVPDRKKVVITYQAQVLGTGSVSYSNTAALKGGEYTSVSEDNVVISSSANAGAASAAITVHKVDSTNAAKNLSGAKYKLYVVTDGAWTEVTTDEFTTGSDGTVRIFGVQETDGWYLKDGETYYLVEEIAPDGYETANSYTEETTGEKYAAKFKITYDNPSDDSEYKGGSTITAGDEPERGNLTVTKHVGKAAEDGAADEDETNAEEFSFTITLTYQKKYESTTFQVSKDGETRIVTLPSTETETGTYTETFTLKDGKSIEFLEIPAGTTYVVEETSESSEGYTAVWTVTDEGNASGTIEKDKTETAFCTNVPDVSITIEGSKTLTGRSLTEGEFSFGIYEEDGETEAEAAELAVVQNQEDGSFTFTLNYDMEDMRISDGLYHNGDTDPVTREYVIKEVVPDGASTTWNGKYKMDGITYDGTEYKVTVTLTYDMETGILIPEVKITDKDGEEVKTTDFKNTYTAYGTWKPTGTKTLTGRDFIEGETFSFQVMEGSTVVASGTSSANGSISFSNVSYDLEDVGIHNYTVSEVQGSTDGITYDSTVYHVSVSVGDGGKGELIVSASYTDGDVSFLNVYESATTTTTTTTELTTESTTENTAESTMESTTRSTTETITESATESTTESTTENTTETTAETTAGNPGIFVEKQLRLNGEAISAVSQTFYVALFEDAACTVRVSGVQVLSFQNASSAIVEFDELETGKTYYIAEVDENGNAISGGTLADGTAYSPFYASGQAAEVTDADGTVTLTMENDFVEWPEGFFKEAKLLITKVLLASDGSEKESDETFYVGIFADEDYTTLSDKVDTSIVALQMNGNSSATAEIPVAYGEDDSFTLYVTEVDENGTPVADLDSFGYTLTVTGSEVTINDDNQSASVTLTNQENAETPASETTSAEASETSAALTPTPTPVTSPETGDDTPTGRYAMLLMAAAAVIGTAFTKRRRRRN